jgi:hypothetical protein
MASKAKPFVYRGATRTAEDITRRTKMSSGAYDSTVLEGFTIFKPKEGENTIRILPLTWEDTDKYGTSWEIMVYVHNNIGPDKGQFLCLDKMKGEPCPICEARRSAVDDEERYALSPNMRAMCWLIDRDAENAGPQWWQMPIKKIFKVVNSRSIDKKTGAPILIDDPEEGYDLAFTREGTGLKTDYTGVEVFRDPTPVHEDQKTQDRWLAYIMENPLPDILNFQEADYIEKVLSGRVSKKQADEDEGDDPKPEPRSTRRRPAAVEEEPEAELAPRTTRRRPVEAEEESAEETEERAAPSTTRRVGRARPEPEPDAEEESEPEADTRPAGRRRPSKEEPPAEEEEAEPAPPTTRRRAVAAAEPEEEEEIPPQSRSARAGLEKLRPRR